MSSLHLKPLKSVKSLQFSHNSWIAQSRGIFRNVYAYCQRLKRTNDIKTLFKAIMKGKQSSFKFHIFCQKSTNEFRKSESVELFFTRIHRTFTLQFFNCFCFRDFFANQQQQQQQQQPEQQQFQARQQQGFNQGQQQPQQQGDAPRRTRLNSNFFGKMSKIKK